MIDMNLVSKDTEDELSVILCLSSIFYQISNEVDWVEDNVDMAVPASKKTCDKIGTLGQKQRPINAIEKRVWV